MNSLLFPDIPYKVKKNAEKTYIFDEFRQKYVVLTPEEWVRQHAVHYLVKQLFYPKSLITLEKSHRLNTRIKRTDIEVFKSNLQLFLLVECKAPTIKLNESHFFQLQTYNRSKQAQYIALTNGLELFVWESAGESPKPIDGFPLFVAK